MILTEVGRNGKVEWNSISMPANNKLKMETADVVQIVINDN